MKKKIVITALTVMLATSMVTPAYAALPSGAPTVTRAEDTSDALRTWADQFTEELKALPSDRERYYRMCELVATNWSSITELVSGDKMISEYMDGRIGAEGYALMIARMCDNVGIPARQSIHFVGEMHVPSAYVQIDGVTYTQSIAGIQTYGISDKYVFIDKDFDNLHIPEDPFVPVEQPKPIEGPMSKFTVIGDPILGEKVIYDADNTVVKYVLGPGGPFSQTGDSKYYKCENASLTPITEEEALSLGYVKN